MRVPPDVSIERMHPGLSSLELGVVDGPCIPSLFRLLHGFALASRPHLQRCRLQIGPPRGNIQPLLLFVSRLARMADHVELVLVHRGDAWPNEDLTYAMERLVPLPHVHVLVHH